MVLLKQIKDYEKLKAEFLKLLDEEHNEQFYQDYLAHNSFLVPWEFIQNHGIHLNLCIRKLALSNDYTTDFFYLSKSSGDWNCVLIEIEKPSSKYFKDGTSEFHSDFTTAVNQINNWRAWFSKPVNFNHFIDNTLKMIRVPSYLADTPCFIKYVLVMGRRKEYLENSHRRNLIQAQKREDFHILSYDNLIKGPSSGGNIYIGVRKNDHIEIISEDYICDSIFTTMPAEQLRIKEQLQTDIFANRNDWTSKFSVDSAEAESQFEEKIKKIRKI